MMKTPEEWLAYFDDNVTAHLTSDEDARLRNFVALVQSDAHATGRAEGMREAAKICEIHERNQMQQPEPNLTAAEQSRQNKVAILAAINQRKGKG